jgi:hypothetical protein
MNQNSNATSQIVWPHYVTNINTTIAKKNEIAAGNIIIPMTSKRP